MIEYASRGLAGLGGLVELAHDTGLKLETVVALGTANNLGCLFGNDGKLKSSIELRSLEATGRLGKPPTPQQRVVEAFAHRWPEQQRTPAQKVAELYRLRAEWD